MDLLTPALRQYRHNGDCSPDAEQGYVVAYDREETDRIVAARIAELEQRVEDAFKSGSSAGYWRCYAGCENLPSEKEADLDTWQHRRSATGGE